jgi:hypothetical protein
MDARGSPDRPRATTAHGGRAGDDSAKDDTRRAVRTVTMATVLIGGPVFLLGVLTPASAQGGCTSDPRP